MRYNYYVNTTKYDFKERKMFCKHCGKNIYDLEKCPFCNDGEKLDGQASKETVATEEPKTTEAANESAEATQKKDATKPQENESTVASKENASKSFINPYEPTKETVGFHRRLIKENKFYNAFETIGLIALIAGIVGAIAFIVASFIKNGVSQLGVLGTIVKGIYNYMPFAYAFLLLFGIAEIVQMIVYIVNANKKATNKEMFADVCNSECDTYIYGSTQLTPAWEAISFKYGKKDFVCQIIMYVVRFIELSIIAIFGTLALAIFLNNIDYGIGKAAKAMLLSFPGFVLLVTEFIIETLVVRILEMIMKGQRKALVAKLRRGELENVNQENKNEQ